MNNSYPFSELQTLLSSAQNILLVFPKSCSFDQVASALALFLSLRKTGKQVSILAPQPMTVEFSHLVGVDEVKDKIGGQDLVLTIDEPVENIEKVTSNDEGGKLNLVIRAKSGLPALAKEKIIFSSSGGRVDLVFLVGVQEFKDLEKIYEENPNLFQQKPLVMINHRPPTDQGQLNIINPQASSCSEIVTSLIQSLSLPVDEDIASNLLLGLENSTQNFQLAPTTPTTFEAAAFCLRAGARRKPVGAEEKEPPPPSSDWFEPKIYKGSTLP